MLAKDILGSHWRLLLPIHLLFKIRSETCRTEAQFCQNLYMVKKKSLPDRPQFCRSGSAVWHLFWRLFACGMDCSLVCKYQYTHMHSLQQKHFLYICIYYYVNLCYISLTTPEMYLYFNCLAKLSSLSLLISLYSEVTCTGKFQIWTHAAKI